jgi:hypothetical protein
MDDDDASKAKVVIRGNWVLSTYCAYILQSNLTVCVRRCKALPPWPSWNCAREAFAGTQSAHPTQNTHNTHNTHTTQTPNTHTTHTTHITHTKYQIPPRHPRHPIYTQTHTDTHTHTHAPYTPYTLHTHSSCVTSCLGEQRALTNARAGRQGAK